MTRSIRHNVSKRVATIRLATVSRRHHSRDERVFGLVPGLAARQKIGALLGVPMSKEFDRGARPIMNVPEFHAEAGKLHVLRRRTELHERTHQIGEIESLILLRFRASPRPRCRLLF